MSQLGTVEQPLRVAIIGSGPSGFYAAEHLLKQSNLVIFIDMYDRLPTPYGLVRGGVAPDHDKIKSVSKVYDRIAANPRFRFFGNVEIGKHITHDDLKAYYHQIVYAVGAQTDRRLGVPGEDLIGSHAATEFVGWYNAHPDYRDLQFDLSQERAVVIGNGNVAMDVARILASGYDELRKTDIADYALEALRNSKVKEIYMLGRRGPAQAAFTNPELKEFGALEEADIVVNVEDATLDPLSQSDLDTNGDADSRKNVELLQKYAQQQPVGKPKRITMRFLVSPAELIGTERVEAIKIVKNVLERGSDGSLKAKATDQTEILPVGLVFRSIGYKGVPLAGVPFDAKAGVIPNQAGRVIDPQTQQTLTGEYVVGWIKRGPSGIIGTNKPDSVATANAMLEDVPTLTATVNTADIEALIKQRQPDYVTFADWQLLDQVEVNNGQAEGRPRIKFSRIEDMIAAIKTARVSNPTS
ncbi:MAG: FAD-dependent oxidoreductase [Anaerolineae bacterium]|nr:FAD-dependent oxidoreductase [Anaerolineae bacterium]